MNRSILILIISLGFGAIFVAPNARATMEPAVPVRTVAPVYPAALKQAKITGVVSLIFEVDAQGNVEDPKVQRSSHPEFEQPALDAIKKWKFKPGRKDGVPVKMKVVIPLQFTLNDD